MPIHLFFPSCLHTQTLASFLWQSDICGLPFNSHSHLHPFPLPFPAVTSHFTLNSTSSSSHCIVQPHLPLSQSCQGSALWLHSFSHCQHAHFLHFSKPWSSLTASSLSNFASLMKAVSNMGTDEYSALAGFLEQRYGRERLVVIM